MATPHVVWLVSAILAFKYNLRGKINEIKKILKSNTDPVDTESTKPIWWFINMEKVMDYLWVAKDWEWNIPQPQPNPQPQPTNNLKLKAYVYKKNNDIYLKIDITDDNQIKYFFVKFNNYMIQEDYPNLNSIHKNLNVFKYLKEWNNIIYIYAKDKNWNIGIKKINYEFHLFKDDKRDITPPNIITTVKSINNGKVSFKLKITEDKSNITKVYIKHNGKLISKEFPNNKLFEKEYDNLPLKKWFNLFSILAINEQGLQKLW